MHYPVIIYCLILPAYTISAAIVKNIASASRPQDATRNLFGASASETLPGRFHSSVTDSSGDDLFNNVTVYHSPTFPSQEQKRQPLRRSYPVTTCEQGETFIRSACQLAGSVRGWTVTCRANRAVRWHDTAGNCSDSQICVNGRVTHTVDGRDVSLLAYCVPMESLVRVAQTCLELEDREGCQLEYDTAARYLQERVFELAGVFSRVGNSPGAEIEMVAVNAAEDTLVTASSLGLEAQSVHEIFDAVSYTTLNKGFQSCENCARTGLHPVPRGTQVLKASAVLPAGESFANTMLWLAILPAS